ncbi:MAG TPA: GNAT family N-acetyltransferase [Baekduia sp.]|nr:GNAT family N-acetyltransferase [Baekduia sp.]
MSATNRPLPVRLARRAARRTLNWIRWESERYIWHEMPLEDAVPFTSRAVDTSELVVRAAVKEDMPALERMDFPYLERYEEFLSKDGILWVGEVPEGLVAAFWTFHSGMPLYPWFDLPEGTFAVEHALVSPDIRGLGFGPVILGAKLIEMREAGYRVAVLKILDDNRRSLKTARRIGFRPTCLMYRRTVLGRTRTVVEPWTPFARHLVRETDAQIAARSADG